MSPFRTETMLSWDQGSTVLLGHAPVLAVLADPPSGAISGTYALAGALAIATTAFVRLPIGRFFRLSGYVHGLAPAILLTAAALADEGGSEASMARSLRVTSGLFALVLATHFAERPPTVGSASSLARRSIPPASEGRRRVRAVLTFGLSAASALGLIVVPQLAHDASRFDRAFGAVVGASLALATALASLPTAMRRTPRRALPTWRIGLLGIIAVALVAGALASR